MFTALTLSALISTFAFGAPPVPCPPGQARAPVAVVDGAVAGTCLPIDDGTTKAAPHDVGRYAELEKKASPKVAEFRGGSVGIYLSGGAVILVLVIVLLVVLL